MDSLAFLLVPFVLTLVLSGIHVYLGIHVLARGIIFVDLALAQVAALGTTVGFWYGLEIDSAGAYAFGLAFTFAAALLFSATRRTASLIPQEALIGIVYVVASAAMILALDRAPHGAEQIKALLARDILWVQQWDVVAKLALVYAAIGFFHWLFRAPFLKATLFPQRITPRALFFWDLIFYGTFGVVVTSSVQVAGVLLVFTYLIVPAVIAALFTHTIAMRLVIGWLVALLASIIALLLSFGLDLPTGPTVVVTFGAVLAVSGLLKTIVGRTEHRPKT